MKKIFLIIALATAVSLFCSCGKDDDDDNIDLGDYQKWRDQNDAWVQELQSKRNPDGTPYYTTVIPAWNPSIYVLMHWFNDRAETADNLVPLYTSVVDVRYVGLTCEGDTFDSSIATNLYGKPGIQRFACNQTIQGWSVAMEQMHVGDTCEVIVPYEAGYGTQASSALKPYSSLQFNLRLEDIYKYEASQY